MMESNAANDPRRGWRLILARALWFLIAAVIIVSLVLALPIRLFDITETLAPAIFGGVSAPFGITAHFFAVYITTGEILLGFLIWFTVGVLVFWRKSDEVLVTYFSAILVAASVFLSDFAMSFAVQRPAWSTLIYLMRAFTYAGIVVFYYIFPNGRFVPRITRLLVVVWIAYTVSWIFYPELIPPSNHIITNPRQIVLGIWFLLWLGSGALSQIYRYRRVRNAIEKQQTKWIVFGTSAAAFGTVVTFSPPFFLPALRAPGPAMVL